MAACEQITHFSDSLGKEMNLRIYGHAGVPFIGFPTQDSMCDNYENFRMIDTMEEELNEGKMQLFCVDSVDRESWSARGGDNGWRAWRQEQYFHYIVDEVVPLIHERNSCNTLPVTMGFSMGGTHAAVTFLRRPDLFSGMLAISGIYDADYFFDGWMDSTLYDSSPVHFMANMPVDHPYIDIYNQKEMIFCVGQGAWEDEGIRTLRRLQDIFHMKGIRAWTDFWGYDVNHDWPWWYKMVQYFLPRFL